MTPQELKNSILQLAIQGKLVEQRPEEGTAAELVEKILAAKNAKGAKGSLTRSRGARGGKSGGSRAACRVSSVPDVPPIPDDEKPFDIPESWEWVRLGEAFDIEMGQSPDGASVSESSGGLEFHQGKIFFGDKYLKQSPQQTTAPTKIAEPNSVLLCVRAPVGKVNITNRRICIGRGLCSVLPLAGMDVNFVYYLLAAFETTFVRHATGTTFVAITGKVVKSLPIPLPPLAEQKRIVAKIEELLPLIDRYEKAWSKLEDFNRRFPVDMQKSVLQMAIQGKLVDHRPEEGTGEELYRQIQAEKQRLVKSGKIKKEKTLPEITEDEIPFDIPDGWKWVRLSNVVDVRDGTHDTPKYVSDGVPLVTSKNLINGTIDFATAKHISHEDSDAINIRSGVDDGDILFAMIGTIGNPVLVRKDREFSIKNMALFKPIKNGLFSMEYLMQFLVKAQVDMRKSASASVQSFVSLSFLRNYLFPLPPLAEQKRIVAKLEEILPLCERLK